MTGDEIVLALAFGSLLGGFYGAADYLFGWRRQK